MVCLVVVVIVIDIAIFCLSKEPPRFVNQSKSLQIAPHYSTVYFLCQIYGVPIPIVSWYKILEKNKQTNGNDDLQLLAIDHQQYVD